MNVKLTATQTTVLKAAANRPDGNIEPLPSNLRGGARAKVIEGLFARGLIVDVNGHYRLTDAGYTAVGKQRPVPKGVQKMDAPDALTKRDPIDVIQKLEITPHAMAAVVSFASGALFDNDYLPYLGIIAAIIGFLMWFLYNKTPHGKYMYAIGGNENSAEVSGINTVKTKLIIYMTAGLMYGIAGFLLGAKSGGASVNMGMGYELEAIAGCTIGGVSTNGGVGRISGILIGVLVFELLKIAMQFMGVETSYTYIVQGIVIIIAVALDIRKYVAKR